MIRESGNERHDSAALVRPGARPALAIFLKTDVLVMERVPATRESAQRLGLVTIEQMVSALVRSIEIPHTGYGSCVPEIRGNGMN